MATWFNRHSRFSRALVTAFALALAFSAGSFFVAVGSSGPAGTTFYACLTRSGIISKLSVDRPISCPGNQTAVHWISYAPETLEALYGQRELDIRVTTDMIEDGAVTTAKLAGHSITTDKLADNSVITAKIADGSITTSKLAPDSVTNAHLTNDVVTSTEIVDGSITAADLADGSVTADTIADGSVTGIDIDSSQVQRRVTGSCPSESMMQSVNQDGSVVCQPVPVTGIYVTQYDVLLDPNSVVGELVACRQGDLAIAGGVSYLSGGGPDTMRVTHSLPSGSNWLVQVENLSHLGPMRVLFYVTCLEQ
jgi:hypothetical protein